ncbi:MAG TPA: hypothetical protein P5567_04660 [Kiritimatiellia bacterium]|nr:hypothetical protein [Kiritimatiellia bacterium]HSA19671.1 hypothetical protein [Kiritimatiellia bacterium]
MRNACKKAVWSGAALLCGLMILSSSGQSEVYSVNVVGFQKGSATSNALTMTSTPFSKTSNNLDGVIGNQLTSGKTDGGADNVALWDSTNQTYKRYWLKSSDTNWYTLAGARATNVFVTTYDGIWIQSRRATNQTVVFSGDVPEMDTATNFLQPGMNLVSYPFSTDIDINSSGLTNGKSGKTDGGADNIAIWDPASQAYTRYWLKTDRKWYTLAGSLATGVKVGAGRGFWYQNRTNVVFNWVEHRPYTF